MSDDTNELVEHFFRHESARLIAVLTRVFGLSRLELVEDTVQAALVEALQSWKSKGVPDNPAAWIHRVAKNKAIDVVRREKRERTATERIAAEFAQATSPSSSRSSSIADWNQLFEEDHVGDSMLRMIFACCSPKLERKSQVALCLKVLCGFGVREIASAQLIGVENAKKRVQRAKRMLQESRIKLEVPDPHVLTDRLSSVHEVLYLMFNEGYSSTTGSRTIREDVCEEAARLCHLLCQDSSTSNESTKALLALMLFHAARFDSRTETDGSVAGLREQDRSIWDRKLISAAEIWLARSAKPGVISTFHLEAGIAMQHCKAGCYDDTDWAVIVRLYDRLIEMQPTSIYVLNRAIATAELGQTDLALQELNAISNDKSIQKYSYWHGALAYVYRLKGERTQALEHWRLALEFATADHEKQFIEKQIAECESNLSD